MTYKCNLNCEYCYVDKRSEKTMRLRVALLAVDFLIKNNKKSKNPIDIIFTGGEPLLEWGKMVKIIFYAKRLAAKENIPIRTIGFPTNGVLLNRNILDFCRREKIKISISVDGKNNKRKTLAGKNSYYLLKNKWSLMLEYKDIIRIRSTVHPDYVSESLKIFNFLLRMGFNKIDMQPAIGIMWTPKRRGAYLENLLKSLDKAEKAKQKNKINIDLKHLRDFVNDCQKEKCCPKVKTEFLVDIDGNIYPCEFYLSIPIEQRKKYALGNVKGIIKKKLAKSIMWHKICNFSSGIPVLKNKCSSCQQSQACFKICLGYDLQRKKFNPHVARNSWLLFRKIEKIFDKYKYLARLD